MSSKACLVPSTLALSAALSFSAYAADPVIPAADPIPERYVEPSRFCDAYVGLQGGYVWGDPSYSGQITASTMFEDYVLEQGKNDGFQGGLYAGCNFRSGSFLLGFEGDINLMDVGYGDNWYATLRLRAGHSFGNTLIYGTGGLAVGQVDMISGNPIATELMAMSSSYYVDKPVATGWAAGAGVEHWFNDRISWKAEYLYVDLGEVTRFGMNAGYEMDMLRVDWKAHTVRTGVALHW